MNRREWVLTSLSVLALGSVARATPQEMSEAIRAFTGGAPVKPGRVTLDIPPLTENGNSVPMTVSVASPMTERDFVKRIGIFNEKNPQPHVATAFLGPRAGRAAFSTRIRLADSQMVTAIAEMSDGSFHSASIDVLVTLAACLEN